MAVPFIIVGIVALVAALITVSRLKSRMKTAHSKYAATDSLKKDSFELDVKSDRFLYTTTERVRISNGNQGGGAKPAGAPNQAAPGARRTGNPQEK